MAGLLAGGSLTGILYSYSKLVSSMWNLISLGKHKAYSTCESHISIISLFYNTSLGMFVTSADTHSSHSSAAASVMYTVVTPMLNPISYRVRNKYINRALKRSFVEETKGQMS